MLKYLIRTVVSYLMFIMVITLLKSTVINPMKQMTANLDNMLSGKPVAMQKAPSFDLEKELNALLSKFK